MSEVMNVGTSVMGVGSGRASLRIALDQCINALEWQAREAGHELAYGSIELSTETRQIELRTLTQQASKMEFNRVMHATGIAVRVDRDTPKSDVAQPTS
jgi:hypothetical protein